MKLVEREKQLLAWMRRRSCEIWASVVTIAAAIGFGCAAFAGVHGLGGKLAIVTVIFVVANAILGLVWGAWAWDWD